MRISVPIFNVNIHVHVCDDMRELLSKYGNNDDGELGKACTFYTKNNATTQLHVAFERIVDKASIYIVAAHESVHLVNMIFKLRGISPDLDNDETQAYLTAFIFNKISTYYEDRQSSRGSRKGG